MAKAKQNYDDSNLPRFDDMDPASLVAWVTAYTLAKLSKHTKAELVARGWYDSAGVDLYSLTSAGVWIAKATTLGHPETSILTYTQYIESMLKAPPEAGRIRDWAGSWSNITAYPLKCALIAQSLGAGGTLAATELVALVAGKKLCPQKLVLELDPVTANISAVGGNAAVCTLDNSGGTILGYGILSHTKQSTECELVGSPVAGENLRLTVVAGTAGNVGASKIKGYLLYREI